MLVEYSVSKKDLSNLLKTLELLQPEDELAFVNNIELRSVKQGYVSIIVERSANHASRQRPLNEKTEKELEMELLHLLAFEKFLNREFSQLREQLVQVMDEMQSRTTNSDVSVDGIPKDVEKQLAQLLDNLLGDQSSSS